MYFTIFLGLKFTKRPPANVVPQISLLNSIVLVFNFSKLFAEGQSIHLQHDTEIILHLPE